MMCQSLRIKKHFKMLSAEMFRPNYEIKKIYVFQVTWNFKIGMIGWKIFLFCLKFLYEVNRKTIWPNREIPTPPKKL